MADYSPPLSPDIFWIFKRPDLSYSPPLSPNIIFTFGVDNVDPEESGYLKSNYMILLTM